MALSKTKQKGKSKKKNVKKTRKEVRKEQRKLKKVLRNTYYTNKSNKAAGKFVRKPESDDEKSFKKHKVEEQKQKRPLKRKVKEDFADEVIRERQKEKRHQECLENEMSKRRNKQLLEANEKEDESIKKLEKQLNLKNKGKRAVPKTFAEDGLDYLLELCEPETLEQAAKTEKQLANIKHTDDFDEDIDIALGEGSDESSDDENSMDDKNSIIDDENSMDDEDSEFGDTLDSSRDLKSKNRSANSNEDDFSHSDDNDHSTDEELNDLTLKLESCVSDESENCDSLSDHDELAFNCLSTQEKGSKSSGKKQTNKTNGQKSTEGEGDSSEEDEIGSNSEKETEKDDFWEDIYGRKRDKKGNVIEEKSGKYIPPQARAKMLSNEQSEKIQRMKRQIKGLLNKLTGQNIHSIASELEGVYMSNSRHDTSDTLTNLSLEFVVNGRLVSDIMLAHHAMLIAVLHTNVGAEVGSYYLETTVVQFNKMLSEDLPVEDKRLDNIVGLLSHLYNFKIYSSALLLDVLTKLSASLNEKCLDCVLIVLRTSGFFMRKDDPGTLKDVILKLQATANSAPAEIKSNSRMKFMLDVLLAIKNNNISKIPAYDHTQAEHLCKTVKNHYRKGNYTSTLNIKMDDLLNADKQGRWWLVGSAWAGTKSNDTTSTESVSNPGVYSKQLLDLAKAQRMNTDIRKNIFCAIVSAEDYLDAFEKVSHLGLRNSQEREVSYVLLSCCLQEKTYNPYYSVLAQKFCDSDRKYQMSFQYGLWDKLRDLSSLNTVQLKNLAKFLIHLIVERGLPISVLKVIEFSELQKLQLRLMRQILLGILLNPAEYAVKEVFERVSVGQKLNLFRQGLRLFLQHFLKDESNTSNKLNDQQKELLKKRIKMVDQLLSAGQSYVNL